ncbi:MAG: hypothetical protein B6D63_02750 [Candidatus Latescibacteria bacterium 4484_7]|nr:MAG: hypothetical protein B6D63_02750 [Candidatus Latescibacteria bacterium 4484_7]
MKHTLFSKIYLGYLFLIVILSTLIIAFTLPGMKKSYIANLKEELVFLAQSIEDDVTAYIDRGDYAGLDSFVKEVGRRGRQRITVIAPDGTVLADSREDPSTMENHSRRPEVQGALAGRIASSLRYSSTVKEEMLYVAMPIEDGGHIVCILRVSFFLKDIRVLLDTLRRDIVTIVAVVALVALIAALLLSRTITKPIGDFVDKVNLVAEGNLDTRIILKGKGEGELKVLADSFNAMAERLQALVDDLSAKRDELENTIASLSDPLVLIDEEMKVVLYNDAFGELARKEGAYTQSSTLDKKPIWEALRSPDLVPFIERTKEDGRAKREIAIDSSIFVCSGGFIAAAGETVIIFHDVTELKRLEQIKKDFVTNVSHELRTPLTVIQGYIETLEEEAVGEQKRYIEVMKRHTANLMNIVEDLLTLSGLEEGKVTANFADVDIRTVVSDAVELFRSKAAEKGLVLDADVAPRLPSIHGDAMRLEQMLINLIDNAIRYTDRGSVRIVVGADGESMRIEVRDTGIGIPRNHQSRIFERFYVVDKSRSRESGGTGLGLSIVKHIVLLHGGSIDVRSGPGGGTTFVITLPISRTPRG